MKKNELVPILLIAVGLAFPAIADVVKYPTREVSGSGPYPYNYRVIDGTIHAGGHPLNPRTDFGNTDRQVRSILNYLKAQGIRTIIDLENTGRVQQRYQRLLDEAGLKRIRIPMHANKVPNAEEWAKIKTTFATEAAYVHCKWGADRAGSVIGRYLVEEKRYSSPEAYQAVISGGSHAGYLGGLKQSWFYRRLKEFIWQGP